MEEVEQVEEVKWKVDEVEEVEQVAHYSIRFDGFRRHSSMVRPGRWGVPLAFVIAVAIWAVPGVPEPPGPVPAVAPGAEWRSYGATELSTRYSPLDQINRDNVRNLEVAWRWRFDNFGTPSETAATQTTPLMVNGVLYFTAGGRRSVVAAKADTGETLWTWRIDEGARYDAAPRKIHRGVAYWTDGTAGAHRSRHARIPTGVARREDRQARRRMDHIRFFQDLRLYHQNADCVCTHQRRGSQSCSY